MTDKLLFEWAEHDVLTLTINRPSRRNAVDPELLAALAQTLRENGERAGSVILRGAGDEAFSAGYDLSLLTGTAADLDADRFIGEAVAAIRECPAPVIARLSGHCHGAGVELALTCDLRVATPSLRMSVPAVGLGVVYRYEFVARLVLLSGLSRAATLLLGMRELDFETASQWGLVNEASSHEELDARIQAVAERLAAAPRAAVRGTKASLNLLAARGVSGEDAARAQDLRVAAAGSPERQEALKRRQKKVTG
ncbi:MAG TPA: enoyl-CoA hydratase-related protein [Candidatus Dormibacteraeota bacterium]|nr:enoyl-CoA hydratase-related protein [Candidatus Dormibacteraeota bacterium]